MDSVDFRSNPPTDEAPAAQSPSGSLCQASCTRLLSIYTELLIINKTVLDQEQLILLLLLLLRRPSFKQDS